MRSSCSPITGTPTRPRSRSAATAAFFSAALVLEKLFTIHHARRYIVEYIPKPKIVAPSQAVAA